MKHMKQTATNIGLALMLLLLILVFLSAGGWADKGSRNIEPYPVDKNIPPAPKWVEDILSIDL